MVLETQSKTWSRLKTKYNMATNSQSSTLEATLNQEAIVSINSRGLTDTLSIKRHKLNGQNFLQWSQSVIVKT